MRAIVLFLALLSVLTLQAKDYPNWFKKTPIGNETYYYKIVGGRGLTYDDADKQAKNEIINFSRMALGVSVGMSALDVPKDSLIGMGAMGEIEFVEVCRYPISEVEFWGEVWILFQVQRNKNIKPDYNLFTECNSEPPAKINDKLTYMQKLLKDEKQNAEQIQQQLLTKSQQITESDKKIAKLKNDVFAAEVDKAAWLEDKKRYNKTLKYHSEAAQLYALTNSIISNLHNGSSRSFPF